VNNPQAVGATVLLNNNGMTQLALVGQFDSSKTSLGEYRIHFGLGRNVADDLSITVRWPNGTVQVVDGVHANQILVVRYSVDESAE